MKPEATRAPGCTISNLWYGLRGIPYYPYDGSALVSWDSGTPPSPLVNQPNREGADPHSHPRNEPNARVQKSEFLKLSGGVVRVCGDGPCFANGYTGP